MYHRFPERNGRNFDRQCEFLATHYRVVPLAEAARRLKDCEPISNLAVITVDDGYADMREVAFPILEKHGLPATLFVTTGFIDRTCWMAGDRVRDYFAHTGEDEVRVTDDRGEVYVFSRRSDRSPGDLRALLKRVPNRTRSRILSELSGGGPEREGAPVPEEFRPCTWDQVREMAGGGIGIGAHTVTHPILSRLETEEETEREILDSKACLERELGRSVDSFAYPNGMPEDISAVSVECVRTHFGCAVTASFGQNAPGADVYRMPRLPCGPEMPVPQMERMMAGPLLRGRRP